MDRIEQNELDIIDIKKLTKLQKKQVVSLVEKFNEDNKETTADNFHVCPKCGKSRPKITKAGRTKGGKQMYLCHECRKRFVEDIGKPSYSSWYGISAWRIFIEDTIQGKTQDESAKKLITWEGYYEYNHLNNVNSLHSKMEERHKRCHGVANKYLPRYCALWAKVHSLSGQDLADKVKSVLRLYVRREDGKRLKTSNLKTSNIFVMAKS